MKKYFILILLFFFTLVAFAQDVYVKGYYRKNGTYVQPHYRTKPDNSFNNNYSSYGNTNPYTGKKGTKRQKFGSSYSSGGSSWGNSGGSSWGNSGGYYNKKSNCVSLLFCN